MLTLQRRGFALQTLEGSYLTPWSLTVPPNDGIKGCRQLSHRFRSGQRYLRDAMGDDDFTAKDFSLLGRNPARHHFVRAHPIAGRSERTRLEERDRRDGQTSGRQTAQHSRRLASPISTRRYSIHGVRASFTRSSTEPEPCRPSRSGNVGTGLLRHEAKSSDTR